MNELVESERGLLGTVVLFGVEVEDGFAGFGYRPEQYEPVHYRK